MMNRLRVFRAGFFAKKPAGKPYTAGQFEVCVSCHRITDVPASLPVRQRRGYIESVGQLCEDCYYEIYGKLR